MLGGATPLEAFVEFRDRRAAKTTRPALLAGLTEERSRSSPRTPRPSGSSRRRRAPSTPRRISRRTARWSNCSPTRAFPSTPGGDRPARDPAAGVERRRPIRPALRRGHERLAPRQIAHFELGFIPEQAVELKTAVGLLISGLGRQHILALPRAQRKRIVFEELARFLDTPGGEQIVAESYAQLRKFNCWAVSVMQQYARFKASRIRPAVIGNAKQFFLMRQNDRGDLADLATICRCRRPPSTPSSAIRCRSNSRRRALLVALLFHAHRAAAAVRHAAPHSRRSHAPARLISLLVPRCSPAARHPPAKPRNRGRGSRLRARLRQAVKEQYWLIQNQQRRPAPADQPRHTMKHSFSSSCSRAVVQRAMDRQRPGQHGGQHRRAGRPGRQPHRDPAAVGRAVGAAQPPAPRTRATARRAARIREVMGNPSAAGRHGRPARPRRHRPRTHVWRNLAGHAPAHGRHRLTAAHLRRHLPTAR
jgi:hypothetical protein